MPLPASQCRLKKPGRCRLDDLFLGEGNQISRASGGDAANVRAAGDDAVAELVVQVHVVQRPLRGRAVVAGGGRRRQRLGVEVAAQLSVRAEVSWTAAAKLHGAAMKRTVNRFDGHLVLLKLLAPSRETRSGHCIGCASF